MAPAAEESPAGPPFLLAEAPPPSGAFVRLPAAQGVGPLDEAATASLLKRLPDLPPEPGRDFARREGPPPPALSGEAVALPFPPPAGPPAGEVTPSGPLEVVRFQPEGDVPLAPHVSLTFSQPMVPLAALDALEQEAVPVRLTPQPPGRWRWVGTRTLVFEPEGGRLPMATEYRVEVPAGTRSQSGGALAAAQAWSFRTPTPQVVSAWPEEGPTGLEPLLGVEFDQEVDPALALAAIRAEAGGRAVALRLASEEEAREQPGQPGRTVHFRAAEPLPGDSAVQVTVGPGVPSREGPRRSEQPHEFAFRTYGPLRVTGHRAGWSDEPPPPGVPWWVSFSNPLDPAGLDPASIGASPPLPGLTVWAAGNELVLRGQGRARTRYTVTLPASLRDEFGQTLGQPVELTFTTGEAEPGFSPGADEFVVLDPAGQPRIPVRTIGLRALKVQVQAVDPAEHWSAWQGWLSERWNEEARPTLPGRTVLETELKVAGSPDAWSETWVDVSAALKEGLGHAVVRVEPADWPRRGWRPHYAAWIQSTRLGLDAQADAGELLAWVTTLQEGRAVAGAQVRLLPDGGAATTDAQGLARLALDEGRERRVLATQGADSTFLPQGWQGAKPGIGLRWFTADDRHLYRPGETVQLAGWIRRVDAGKGGDLLPLGGALREVSYRLVDAGGEALAEGKAPVSAEQGTFSLELKLPDTAHVGGAYVMFDEGHTHVFRVAEFRRPEFEVATALDRAGPFLVGEEAVVSASARYFAGGALPGAEISWQVTARAAEWSPPNRPDFVFGEATPWWLRGWGWDPEEEAVLHEEALDSLCDGQGRHALRLSLRGTQPPRTLSLTCQATVQDVNRQAQSSTAALLLHPAQVYVGLRPKRPFFTAGQDLAVEVLAVDLDGKAVAGRPLQVAFERLTWTWKDGQLEETVAEQVAPVPMTSGAEPIVATVTRPAGGTWRVVATVRDAAGREQRSSVRVWVAGGEPPPRRELEEERVTLIRNQETYAAGDTAEVLILAPFAPAEALISVRRSGLVHVERRRLEQATEVWRFPVEEGHVPDLTVHVALVGSAPRGGQDARRRPAYASGEVTLPVPPTRRALAVEVTPERPELAPGEDTAALLLVRDAAGAPLPGAQVALFVVDEAVLALAGHTAPDPLASFYQPRGAGVLDARGRTHLLLAPPPLEVGALTEESRSGVGAARAAPMDEEAELALAGGATFSFGGEDGAAIGGEEAAAIALRADLRPLALFAPAVRTGPDGRARVPYTLPDSLTRYRLVAVASDGAQRFGAGESVCTARLPLMVRPSAPRFLNVGDTFELPVVVQNQTDEALRVQVAVRASNLRLTAGQGRSLTVPARDRCEVRFPAAALRAGEARVQVAASAGAAADAQEVTLPVWTPATAEAFAAYGVLDEGALAQPVRVPADAWPDYGGLEVTTSSTALQALTDAVIYLADYPYGCSEQLASRVLALAAVRDVLQAFQAEGLPAGPRLEAAVAADLGRLAELQNEDGGYGFWRSGERSWPYLGIHVGHALARARQKGFAVPPETLARLEDYLRTIDFRIPEHYSEESRQALEAYALYVRGLLGDPNPGHARELLAQTELERFSLEALGWLYPLLRGDAAGQADAARIRRHLANRVEETAGAAHFVTRYSDGAQVLLHSERRVDGVLLEALLDDPAEVRGDLAPKLVQGLLAQRKRGHWLNTQENAFVLLALDKYFRLAEATEPDFVARAWLGQSFAGEHAFRGRTTERAEVRVPMAALAAAGPEAHLTLSKEGPGRLYYRLGLRYAPREQRLAARDAGFTVTRRYEAVDAPTDVRRDPDGTWRVKAGARVRVRVVMVAPARRYHVALVDPLPAGLEPLDPALATTGDLPADPEQEAANSGGCWWWARTWYEHTGLRDERAEAFTSLLWEGVHTFSYVARATTPGRFVVPPARAEEMYAPETFGRSASEVLIVE